MTLSPFQEIPLTRGKSAVIDETDWPLVQGRRWYAAYDKGHWYAVASDTVARGERRFMIMHRLIMDAPPELIVTFRDGDSLNCRRSNLIMGRRSGKIANHLSRGVARESRSGYRGVTPHGRRWRVRLFHDGKWHNLGFFDDPREAAIAYDAGVTAVVGANAMTNKKLGRL